MEPIPEYKINKRAVIYKTLFLFLLCNFLITILIGYTYVIKAPGTPDFTAYLYIHIALLSNFLLIYAVIALFLYAILSLVPSRILMMSLVIPIMFLLHCIIFADTTVYRIFKFHINSMVLNLFVTKGAWDSVHVGIITLISFILIIAALLFFEFFLLYKLYEKVEKNFPKYKFKRPLIFIMIALILTVILADKFTYAVSDLYNRITITRYSKLYPLYLPMTMKRFMKKHFNFKLEREESFDFTKKSQILQYPKKPLERKAIGKYPNIVMIIIDAWRYDMFSMDVSPNCFDFSKKSLNFLNHYSGGNASRFGVFSILYGVYSYYWHQFLSERQSSVLIDELLGLKYDFTIISSTKLTYPEFRKTAFIRIPDKIKDELPGNSSDQKDSNLSKYFIDWLKKYDNKNPFFAFLFFDSPHGPYSYPDKFDKFTPSKRTANYITVGEKDKLPLKNSYKNAIYFDDYLTGQIISYLEVNQFLKNTIVIITGDHGEEFYESGYLGHTSSFSKQQTKVPLIVYIPGYKHKDINYLTSHVDVVPTLMELLGYTSPPDVYSNGKPLIDAKDRNYVISCGWDDCAIIDDNYTIVFSSESYNLSEFEIRDSAYKLINNYDSFLKAKFNSILEIIKGIGVFSK